MAKYTQSMLKTYAANGMATDITAWSNEKLYALHKVGISCVGISRGIYGMNGGLFRDNRGNRYVVTARNTALFILV